LRAFLAFIHKDFISKFGKFNHKETYLKHLFIIFALVLITSVTTFSQYTSAESCVYDSVYNRWLVSTSAGIKQRNNATGIITDFAPSGSGTHGIRIYNGNAYACVGTRVKGFALASGTEVFNVQLVGSSFLNGMGIDQSTGIAYISDFSGTKIYKLNLNTQAWWIYVPSPGGTPNGVYVDKPRNRLLVCFWGANAPVKSVSLADSSVTTLTNTGHTNCDGIYLDKYDNVFISSWSPARIIYYNINFTGAAQIAIGSGLSAPADIFINQRGDTIGIPMGTTVQFHNIAITGLNQISGSIPQKFSLGQNYPNPFNPSTKIKFDIPSAGFTKLYVYDALGRTAATLVNGDLKAGSYEFGWNADNYTSGVYFYKLESGSFSEVRKMILVK
jgi:hypothetical protein